MGTFHSAWPGPGLFVQPITLIVPYEAFNAAGTTSGGKFNYKERQTYLARLSFFPTRLAPSKPIVPHREGLVAAQNFAGKGSRPPVL